MVDQRENNDWDRMPLQYEHNELGQLVPKGSMANKKRLDDMTKGVGAMEKGIGYGSAIAVGGAVLGALGYGAYKFFGGGKKKSMKSKKKVLAGSR